LDNFVKTVTSANGKSLKKGPRGGGRTVQEIVDHVVINHYNYLRRINWRERHEKFQDIEEIISAIKLANENALTLAASNEMPKEGPRGGKIWYPRYFVRRAAWHILDHTWEIEDKIES